MVSENQSPAGWSSGGRGRKGHRKGNTSTVLTGPDKWAVTTRGVKVWGVGLAVVVASVALTAWMATSASQSGDYSPSVPLEAAVFYVNGMACAGCVERLEATLSDLDGVVSVEATFENRRAHVQFDPSRIGVDAISNRISQLGHEAAKLELGPAVPATRLASTNAN